MIPGTIVLPNYINKFPSNSTDGTEKKKKKNSARDWRPCYTYGSSSHSTGHVWVIVQPISHKFRFSFKQNLSNFSHFPLSHFHLSLRPIPSLSNSLTKKKKKKRKTFPHFLSLQSPILQFPLRSRVSSQTAFESPISIPSSAYRGFSVGFPLIR